MEQTIIQSFLRSILAYFLVLIVARAMGRKAISQMTFFDFVVAITLGSVTANLALGPRATTASSVTVLLTLGTLAVMTGYIHIKSFWGRKIANSEPIVVIENGKINDDNVRKARFTVNELTSLLREKNIFNVSDVEFALIETDGKLSVLPKSQKQPLTPSDMNIPTSYKGLTRDIIIDGKVLDENLKDAHLDEQWLMTQLNQQKINSVEDVFYAGLDTAGNLYVSLKQKREKEKHGQYGID